ncbi:MAG: HD-GYP domain-containing protein [Candidatus Ratteibacteria bacterium]
MEEKANLERYQIILNSVPCIIFLLDKDKNIIEVNRKIEDTGYKIEEVKGRNIYDLPLFIEKEKLMDVFEKKGEIFKIYILTKEGEKRIGLLEINRAEDDEILIIHDITEEEFLKIKLEKEEELLKENQKLIESTLNGTIYAISKILETRDPFTANHQLNVSKLSEAIAREMGYKKDEIKEIVWASLLHDIGKISIPCEILVVPRKLTNIEFTLIKTHPITGYNILKVIPNFEKVAQIVLQHHERIDGSGYPKGLIGEQILKEARIIGVSDVVEAMSSHRPYRPAFSLEEAIEEIKKNKGIKYDPEVVEICVDLFEKKGFNFD